MFTHMHFRYDIISATFDCVDVDRYKCEVTDPHDVSVSTSATLNDGVMRQHLQSGDVLRVEMLQLAERQCSRRECGMVTAALVAMDLIRVRLDVLRTDVALIAGPIALIPRRPTVVGEFRAHAVQREFAATASEVSGLGILLNELVRPWRFCPILTEAPVRHRR